MIYKYGSKAAAFLAWTLFLFSCNTKENGAALNGFQYEKFKDSVTLVSNNEVHDTSNVFDGNTFIPGIDSVDTFLIRIDTLWHREVWMMENMDALVKELKKGDTMPRLEIERIKENVRVLDSFLTGTDKPAKASCRQNDCLLFAEVVKSKQKLYLYIEGVLKDSFKVSTGVKKYETRSFSVRPSGPLFIKYTSRKFPGGNYKGLGNMPYAVFVLGGYAIHGTTPGNFPKLGTVASHGCIRLHPDNARIFYELVKLIGLKNTWVTVRE